MARPQIVGTPTFEPIANTSGTTSTMVLTTPAGAVAGETLVAVLVCQSQGATDWGVPAGWARFGLAHIDSVNVRNLGFFRLYLTGTPAASYTFTNPVASARRGGMMFRVQGADSTQPRAQSAAYGTYSGGTVSMSTISVPENDCLHLLAGMAGTITNTMVDTISTPPASMTQVGSVMAGLNSSTRTGMYLWQQDVDAGTIPAKAFTWTTTTLAQSTGNAVVLKGVTVNVPPIANAGTDQTVTAGGSVTLVGSGSSDPGGSITSYVWTQTAGTTVTLTGTGSDRTFTAPPAAGTVTFQLTVSDIDGLNSSDSVTITVLAPPVSPAWVGQGVVNNLTTTSTPGYPTGMQAKDIMVLNLYSDVNVVPPLPTGWRSLRAPVLGGGLYGSEYWKTAVGTETGTLSITGMTGGTKGVSYITAYRPANIGMALKAVAQAAPDNDATSTAVAMTGAPWTLATNQRLVSSTCLLAPTDSYTVHLGSRVLANAGVTLLTPTQRFGGRTFGNTLNYTHSDAEVSIGGTGAPSFTATAVGANGTGVSLFTQLYEDVNLPPVANAGPDQTGVLAGSTVTLDGSASLPATTTLTGLSAADTPTITSPDFQEYNVTTIAGGVLHDVKRVGAAGTDLDLAGDTKFRYLGIPASLSVPGITSYGNYFVQLPIKPSGAAQFARWYWQIEFDTNATEIEIRCKDVGTSNEFALKINDKWYSETLIPSDHNTNNRYVIKLVFPTAVTRRIQLRQPGDIGFGGIWTNASATVSRPTTPIRQRAVFIGDSITNGSGIAPTGSRGSIETWAPRIAHLLGIDEPILLGVGGSGWTVGETVDQFGGDRLDVALTMNPHAIFFTGSTNDVINGPGLVTAAVTAAMAKCTAVPNVYLLSTHLNNQAANEQAVRTAAETAGRPFIDFAVLDPTDRTFVGTDSIHPTFEGQKVLTDTVHDVLAADESIEYYVWTQTAGTTVALSGSGPTRTFTAPGGASMTFQLTVTDEYGDSASDTMAVTVAAPSNLPPVANAGPDQTVIALSTVTLTGSASTDPDGSIIAYNWLQTAGPSVALLGTGASRTFIAPAVVGGTSCTFRLTVTDDDSATAQDMMTVTVYPHDLFFLAADGTTWQPAVLSHF